MHCPVCLSTRTAYFDKGTDFLFETTDETFTLRSCNACGCLFLDPMPDPGQIASFYPPGYWWDPSHAGLLRRLEGLYRRIALIDHVSFIARAARAAVPSARARILDVGCGSATVLSLLKEKGLVVMGVDPSAHAAQIAKRDHDIEVAIGTIGEVGLPSDDFNVVVLLHALEHVSNPREVLEEARRLLGEGGRLVLQVPQHRQYPVSVVWRTVVWTRRSTAPDRLLSIFRDEVAGLMRIRGRTDATFQSARQCSGHGFKSFSQPGSGPQGGPRDIRTAVKRRLAGVFDIWRT